MKQTTDMKKHLAGIYDKSALPSLFVTTNFNVYYANNAAIIRFPILATINGLKNIVPEKDHDILKNSIETGIIAEVEIENSSNYKKFIFIPIYNENKKIVCFKVQSDSLSFAAEKVGKYARNQAISEFVKVEMQQPLNIIQMNIEALSKIVPESELHYIETIKTSLENLVSIKQNMDSVLDELKSYSTQSKSIFSAHDVVEEFSKRTGFIRFEKGSEFNSENTKIYGRKDAFVHVLIKCCRFLLLSSKSTAKINIKIIAHDNKIILKLSKIDKEASTRTPFEINISKEDLKIDFGLESARDIVQKEDGNLVVETEKNRLQIYCSFRAANDSNPVYMLSNAIIKSSFLNFENEMNEIVSIYSSTKNKNKLSE